MFSGYRDAFVSIDVLLTWSTSRFAWVAVEHEPRARGQSNYTVGKLILHALNMLTGYSTLPLRLASLVGFLFTVFGIGVLVYVAGRYFVNGGSVPGFPFLALVIAIFSGAQLFASGSSANILLACTREAWIGRYSLYQVEAVMEVPTMNEEHS